MLFHRNSHKSRIKQPTARGRRSFAAFRLEPEFLENRIPMATGFGTALEPIVVARAAEIAILVQSSPSSVATSAGATARPRPFRSLRR